MTITINLMSYFYGHLAGHCIESVLSQSVKPDVINFYDDGAGDCGHLKDLYPEINFIFRTKNLGIINNFNDALDKTETDRVIFLGVDNYLRQDALSLLSLYPEDIVSYDIFLFGTEADSFAANWQLRKKQDGYWIWEFKKGDISKSNYIHGSSLYNVQLAKEVGGYHRRGVQRTEEDWYLFEQMLKSGATHSHIPSPLLYYRRHKHNFNKY